FPCRFEGFETGCVAHKWIPTFVLSNAFVYLPFSLAGVHLFRSNTLRPDGARMIQRLLRWTALSGIAGLCLRLFVHRLSPEVSSTIHNWNIGSVTWTVLDTASGLIAVLFVLAAPF